MTDPSTAAHRDTAIDHDTGDRIDPGDRVTPRRPRMRDRWRRECYLQRLDWHLEAVVRGRDRREIVRSIRDDLIAEDRRMPAALDDLGSPRALARRFGDEDAPLRPVWSVGIIWAGAALLCYWFTFALFALGMLAVVQQSDLDEAHARFFFVDVLAFANADGIGVGWTGDIAWILMPAVIVTVAVLLGARAWRAIPRRGSQQTDPTARRRAE